jgi:membrane protease YdiL (CAAX protease family)
MLEILLVLLTAAAFQVMDPLHLKGAFIAIASAFWISYIAIRCWRDPGLPRRWGFTTRNLRAATLASAVVLVLGVAVMLAYAAMNGTVQMVPHLLPVLLLYPIWGLLQQFLLNALVARNLRERLPAIATVLISAILFGLVHYPGPGLMILTAIAAIVWVPIYLKWRNLWPLGLIHAWLGAAAYYWILGRDPWASAF